MLYNKKRDVYDYTYVFIDFLIVPFAMISLEHE